MNEIHNWKKNNRFRIWKYSDCSKSYKGWHIAINKDFSESVASLLEMISSQETEIKKTVVLDNVDKRVSEITGCKSNFLTAIKLVINFKPIAEELYDVNFDDDVLSLNLSKSSIKKFSDGFRRLSTGEDDFMIYPSDDSKNDLNKGYWFWLYNE